MKAFAEAGRTRAAGPREGNISEVVGSFVGLNRFVRSEMTLQPTERLLIVNNPL
ncbi:MAG: hypothetical protein JHD07_00200 [Bradyrhizobium sp.]|nr:hypothetical protein [Bradyrhizobium sp.]